jgi:hypothetical protein
VAERSDYPLGPSVASWFNSDPALSARLSAAATHPHFKKHLIAARMGPLESLAAARDASRAALAGAGRAARAGLTAACDVRALARRLSRWHAELVALRARCGRALGRAAGELRARAGEAGAATKALLAPFLKLPQPIMSLRAALAGAFDYS